jgi:hypothetical protein
MKKEHKVVDQGKPPSHILLPLRGWEPYGGFVSQG